MAVAVAVGVVFAVGSSSIKLINVKCHPSLMRPKQPKLIQQLPVGCNCNIATQIFRILAVFFSNCFSHTTTLVFGMFLAFLFFDPN